MSSDDKILKIISNETKDSINQMPIVTPSIYASIFSEYAAVHNVDVDNEENLAQDLLQVQCSTLTKMQEETVKSADNLSNSTQKAITAIKDKDESSLNEVLKETEALKAEIEKLKESVYKDELTNVHNRKWLNDTYLTPDTTKLKEAGTLAIIDLNYFKIINDTHGHIVGDKVLIFIANELKKSGYSVVRYGGDEFILIFPQDINQKRAYSILNKMREVIIAKKLKAKNSIFRTSFSIGIQEYAVNADLAQTIESADKNMYEDKLEIKKRVTGIEV